MTTGKELDRRPPAVGALPAEIDFAELLGRAKTLANAGPDVLRKAYQGKPEAIVLVGMRGMELGFSLGYALENIDPIEGRAVLNAQARLTLLRKHGHEARFTESSSERATIRARRREYRDDPDAWVTFTYSIDDAIRGELATLWVERKYRLEGDRYDRTEKYVVGDVVNGVNPELVAKATAAAEADAEARKEAGNAQAAPNLWVKKEVAAGRIKSKDNWRKDPASMLRARAATNICRMEFSDVMAGAGVDPMTADELGVDPDEVARGDDVDVMGRDLEPEQSDEELDIVDGEVLEDAEANQAERAPEPENESEPPPAKEERALAGPQVIAIRLGELGVKDRGEKLSIVGKIVEREISSTKELTPIETRFVLEVLAADTFRAADYLAEPANDGLPAEPEFDVDEPEDEPPPKPARVPTPPAKEAPAVPRPAEWDADAWRAFLRDRGVKVAELLKEAGRLAGEKDLPAPGTLDNVAGSELADTLVGYVEDLALERRGS